MLCVTLGRLPSELRTIGKSSDITQLAAYFLDHPFGPGRDDLHHARTAAAVINGFKDLMYSQGAIRSRKPIQPHEHMLKKRMTDKQKLDRFVKFLDSKVNNGQI